MPVPETTVTFFFSDIEGSTRLLDHLGVRYAEVLREHRELVRAAIVSHAGRELGTAGDGFFVASPTASGAILAAAEIQRTHIEHAWADRALVRVRIGLHTGAAALIDGGYVGMDVHRAARLVTRRSLARAHL